MYASLGCDHLHAFALAYAQAWLPQYKQLDEDSSEKVVAGVFSLYIYTYLVDNFRAHHDSRVLDELGGFAEFKKTWRRYQYARDHAVMCRNAFSIDMSLIGGLGTPWLFWHGQVAEQVAYVQKFASVLDIVIEESGGEASGIEMDAHRQTLPGRFSTIEAGYLCAVGLWTQAALYLRKVGMDEWPSECACRLVDWTSKRPLTQICAPDDPGGQRTFAEYNSGVLQCWECCPQSDAAKELMRSVLHGTAADHRGGVEALGALDRGCRESYCLRHYCLSDRAARIAERLGEHKLAQQYAEQFLARGGFELSVSEMHALLARHAARSGDRDAAVAQWRQAAAAAMDGRWHLFALIVGWQCGGAEGRVIVDAACAAMGRPEEAIRRELQDAGAELEDGTQTRTTADLQSPPATAGAVGGSARKPAPPPGQPPVTRAARPSTPGRRVV